MSAEKVEQLITRPIEEAIAGSAPLHEPKPGSEYAIMSLSLPGISLVRVQLPENVNDVTPSFNELNQHEWIPSTKACSIIGT